MQSLLTDAEVAALRGGGLVIFPTETIYGLGCVATDGAALQRLFALKGRVPGQPPPVLIASTEQLWSLVEHLPDEADRLAAKYWPGALTIIVPARPGLPESLLGCSADGRSTVGVRWTAHTVAQGLCLEVQRPMVGTSANFSGATGTAATPGTLAAIPTAMRQQVDVVLDGGVVAGAPSTVVDCTQRPPRIVRQGALELPPDAERW